MPIGGGEERGHGPYSAAKAGWLPMMSVQAAMVALARLIGSVR